VSESPVFLVSTDFESLAAALYPRGFRPWMCVRPRPQRIKPLPNPWEQGFYRMWLAKTLSRLWPEPSPYREKYGPAPWMARPWES
jgi:hypothetical protein